MCFYSGDCDWYASVVETSESVAEFLDPKRVCLECCEIIQPGDRYVTIYQQEHEECVNDGCEDGCVCDDPDFGETFDYLRCDHCDKFLQAIRSVEHEAGCAPDDQQPLLEGLFEELRNIGQHNSREVKKYVRQALLMFPELKSYFRKHWRRIGGCA